MARKIVALCLVVVFVSTAFTGCKKDKPADTSEPPKETVPKETETPETSGENEKPEEPETPDKVLENIEVKDPQLAEMVAKMFEEAEKKAQKTCPIAGNAINRDIFVVYQGKRVYFCSPACKDKFNADPQKYLPKLPQFQE